MINPPTPDLTSREPQQGGWSVWRQDDNGNQFLIQSNLPEAEALRLVSHYESLGHKQQYWAQHEGAPST